MGHNGHTLFSPVRLGPYTLSNRLVMAPMTRNRAGAGNVPQPVSALYYSQRASAGLIVTEATHVSPQGVEEDVLGLGVKEQLRFFEQLLIAVGHVLLLRVGCRRSQNGHKRNIYFVIADIPLIGITWETPAVWGHFLINKNLLNSFRSSGKTVLNKYPKFPSPISLRARLCLPA